MVGNGFGKKVDSSVERDSGQKGCLCRMGLG